MEEEWDSFFNMRIKLLIRNEQLKTEKKKEKEKGLSGGTTAYPQYLSFRRYPNHTFASVSYF